MTLFARILTGTTTKTINSPLCAHPRTDGEPSLSSHGMFKPAYNVRKLIKYPLLVNVLTPVELVNPLTNQSFEELMLFPLMLLSLPANKSFNILCRLYAFISVYGLREVVDD